MTELTETEEWRKWLEAEKKEWEAKKAIHEETREQARTWFSQNPNELKRPC